MVEEENLSGDDLGSTPPNTKKKKPSYSSANVLYKNIDILAHPHGVEISYLIIPNTPTAKNQLEVLIKTEKKHLNLTWRGGKKLPNGNWTSPHTLYYSIPEKKKDNLLLVFKKIGIPIDEIEFRECIAAPPVPKYIKTANKIAGIGDQYNEALKGVSSKESEELADAERLFDKDDISATDYAQRIQEIKSRYVKEKKYLADTANRNYRAADIINEEGEANTKAGDEEVDPNKVVAEFNKSFAIIETPQFGIMEIGPCLIHKKRDILDRFQNQSLRVGITSGTEPKPIYKTKAEIWLRDSDRNTYYTIDFRPDRSTGEFTENGKRIYNSWAGLAIKGKKGKCDLFKAHMLNIICAGDESSFDYLWNLISTWIQRPWERTCAPVFRGAQGTGKGAFTETIGKIFGAAYLLTNEHEQVFGRFNAVIMGKVLLHLDEALFGGDRRLIGKVKGIITGPQYPIEMKGRDPMPMSNPRKIMISSNESFAIPVDADDRRFFFLDVASHRANDPNYFRDLFHEINNGGLGALVYELMSTNLAGFNPMQLPIGAQKFGFDNKLASANSFIQYLHKVFTEETFDISATAGWVNEIRTDVLHGHYLEFCNQRKLRPITDEQIGREIQKILGLAGLSRMRKRYSGVLKYAYGIPPAFRCREAFAAYFKTTPDIIFGKDCYETDPK